jgi:3'-phosphoadenosine 5'-phosphosulfate sulfotransferase (PAPS reductase)/FAD synthetase
MVRRKQNSSQEEWLDALRNIEHLVPIDHVRRITDIAVSRIIRTTAGKKVAYGWSGGKDSLVLEKICELAGIRRAFLYTTDLEYSDFNAYVDKHAPPYLEKFTTKHDLPWLAKNQQNYLFPERPEYRQQYFIQVQRNGFKQYFKDNDLDQVIIGHRLRDGNNCPDYIVSNRDGFTRSMPLRDWSHEEILAFIHYHGIALPSIYFYEQGFVWGTGPYPSMPRGSRSLMDCWGYVFRHDPGTVIKASRYIESANYFLRGVQS